MRVSEWNTLARTVPGEAWEVLWCAMRSEADYLLRMRCVRPETADDAASAAWIRIRERWPRGEISVRGDPVLGAWCRGVVIRIAREEWRADALTRQAVDRGLDSVAARPDPDSDDPGEAAAPRADDIPRSGAAAEAGADVGPGTVPMLAGASRVLASDSRGPSVPDLFAAVAASGATPGQLAVFACVVGRRLTVAATARQLGVDPSSVRERLVRLVRRLRRGAPTRSGGDADWIPAALELASARGDERAVQVLRGLARGRTHAWNARENGMSRRAVESLVHRWRVRVRCPRPGEAAS